MSTSGSAGRAERTDGHGELRRRNVAALSRPPRLRLESRRRDHRAQQQHIIDVDHRGVGGSGVRLPDRPTVERLEGLTTTLHVCEAPHPHEALRAIQITELSKHFHTDGLLRLDELAVEEFDQHVPLTVPEGVLAKLDNGQQEDSTTSLAAPDHVTELDATPDHGVRLPRPNIPTHRVRYRFGYPRDREPPSQHRCSPSRACTGPGTARVRRQIDVAGSRHRTRNAHRMSRPNDVDRPRLGAHISARVVRNSVAGGSSEAGSACCAPVATSECAPGHSVLSLGKPRKGIASPHSRCWPAPASPAWLPRPPVGDAYLWPPRTTPT